MSARCRCRAGRAFPRRRSKNALDEAGIDYVHLKALGTPADGRCGGAGRAPGRAGAHLRRAARAARGDRSQAEQMRELAAEKPSALLCFERDPAECHRSLLLRRGRSRRRGRRICFPRMPSGGRLRASVSPTSSASMSGIGRPVISLGISQTTRRSASLCSFLRRSPSVLGGATIASASKSLRSARLLTSSAAACAQRSSSCWWKSVSS